MGRRGATMLAAAKRMVRETLRRAASLGWRRHCPSCGSWLRGFRPFGSPVRPEAQCPVCGSLERHRLAWLFLRSSDLTRASGTRRLSVLHLAPEGALLRRLERLPNIEYLTADLSDPAAMVRMDVMDIAHPDGSFDAIVCSHVLEHVEDDAKAMRELRRVLRSGGFAVFQVPLAAAATTLEDPAVTDAADRERLFGQADHVRLYGRDFQSRLESAGFLVRAVTGTDLASGDVVARYGVCGEVLFVATPG